MNTEKTKKELGELIDTFAKEQQFVKDLYKDIRPIFNGYIELMEFVQKISSYEYEYGEARNKAKSLIKRHKKQMEPVYNLMKKMNEEGK